MDSKKIAESEKSRSQSPALHGYGSTADGHIYYVVMERLVTKLNDIEHELKCAWRILDILNQECIKMWERLEKLEGFLYEQQHVITQLVEFHTNENNQAEINITNKTRTDEESSVGELDAIAESLGAAIGIEETSVLREKLAQQELSKMHGLSQETTKSLVPISDLQRNTRYIDALETLEEEITIPDEAFYRSLNNAYREDLKCGDSSRPASQLGMIWEEAEDDDTNGKKDINSSIFENVSEVLKSEKEMQDKVIKSNGEHSEEKKEDEGEVFSAADYKNYRGNTPCISEQDLAQLSRLNSIDETSLGTLHELNRLSSKLQKDSHNFMDMRSRFSESPKRQYFLEGESKLTEETNSIDEQLRKIYAETDVDHWTYSKSPGSTGRSISRVSTDSGLTTDGDFTNRSISPRLNSASRSNLDSISSVYNTSRHGYTSTQLEKSLESLIPLPIDVGNFAKGYAENKELTDLMVDSLTPVTSASLYNVTVTNFSSTSTSLENIHSCRTRQDGYFGNASKMNLLYSDDKSPQSFSPSSPPPPAPLDSNENFLPVNNEEVESDTKLTQSTICLKNLQNSIDQDKLSPRTPHSPKSPKVSPKHLNKSTNNIVTAKSDSGLSSMSGWSSFDKSPSSPKSTMSKMIASYTVDHIWSAHIPKAQSPKVSHTSFLTEITSDHVQESIYDTPEGRDMIINENDNHISSSVTSLKSQTIQGDFDHVPPPAPEVSSSSSAKSTHRKHEMEEAHALIVNTTTIDHLYKNPQSTIYSVAGSNRLDTISVYTTGSNTADAVILNSDYRDSNNPSPIYHNNFNMPQNLAAAATLNSFFTKKSMKTLPYGEGLENSDNCKISISRSMFPTGNITDALSYYPTSVSLPKTESNDKKWLNTVKENIIQTVPISNSNPLASEINCSENFYTAPSYQSTNFHTYSDQGLIQAYQQQYQILHQNSLSAEKSQVYNRYQKQWPNETEIDNFNNRCDIMQPGDYYDASNVIVSQSGYISISADIKDYESELTKMTKKIRRGSSLKNAMNSMSSWLPDLNLSKRHRSQSLPGGIRREDLHLYPEYINQHKVSSGISSEKIRGKGQVTRKKKKHTLVSTVSGILHKAKRKTHQSQSLSDPEQSETEWSSGRQSGVSEDEDTVFSDINQESSLFAKVKSHPKKKTSLPHLQLELQENKKKDILFQNPTLLQQQEELQQQIQQHQELLQQKVAQESWIEECECQSENEMTGKSAEQINGYKEENSEDISMNSSEISSIFQTVGDIKKSGSIEETYTDRAHKLPPVTLMGGASMEFAVSRALGKYRQRQSSTAPDDQTDEIFMEKKSEGNLEKANNYEYQESSDILNNIDSVQKLPEVITNASEETLPSENSPALSAKSHSQSGNRFLPRHQQSLEIPWAGSRSGDGDEDNRSTHSYRSTSRVSSRRQSTEDSIDSEDEWYCYELRKLEELERQSDIQMETDMTNILADESEKFEIYQPDECVKEKMSYVLEELKLKTKSNYEFDKIDSTKGFCGTKMYETSTSAKHRDERPAPKKKSETLETVFARVTDYHTWIHEEDIKRERKSTLIEEGSSGETSGPDSPIHSMDEDEDEMQKELEEPYSRRSSSGSTLRHYEKFHHGSDTLSREGSVSVPPSEVSVSIPGAWDSESLVPEEQDGAGSTETGTTATTHSLPKIKVDTSSCASSDTTLKEGQVSPGPPGSKWKLLKALKERKAEEKLKEVEEATKEAITFAQGSIALCDGKGE